MKVKRLTEKVTQSETSGEHLMNAMRTVSHSSQQIETVQSKVSVIERQIKDSGLGKHTINTLIISCCWRLACFQVGRCGGLNDKALTLLSLELLWMLIEIVTQHTSCMLLYGAIMYNLIQSTESTLQLDPTGLFLNF